MKILAIDSSSLVASVAIVDYPSDKSSDSVMIAEYTVNHKKTHSQTLLPMINEIMNMTEQDISEIDYIAISGGPGSFTGLRIGSATAKGLGLAAGVPLVSVPTVDAMARNFFETDALIVPMMDARRSQVYAGIYARESENPYMEYYNGDEDMSSQADYVFPSLYKTILEQDAMGIDELVGKITDIVKGGGPYARSQVIFLGDGVPAAYDYITEHAEFTYSFAPAHLSRQRAGAVADLAREYIAAGMTVSAAEHAPEYYRLSQAERERNNA